MPPVRSLTANRPEGTAIRLGMVPDAYLANNDSYSFFRQLDFITREQHLLITGPTGTNVMDMQIVLLEG